MVSIIRERDTGFAIARGRDAQRLEDGLRDVVEDLPSVERAAISGRARLRTTGPLRLDDERDVAAAHHQVIATLACRRSADELPPLRRKYVAYPLDDVVLREHPAPFDRKSWSATSIVLTAAPSRASNAVFGPGLAHDFGADRRGSAPTAQSGGLWQGFPAPQYPAEALRLASDQPGLGRIRARRRRALDRTAGSDP